MVKNNLNTNSSQVNNNLQKEQIFSSTQKPSTSKLTIQESINKQKQAESSKHIPISKYQLHNDEGPHIPGLHPRESHEYEQSPSIQLRQKDIVNDGSKVRGVLKYSSTIAFGSEAKLEKQLTKKDKKISTPINNIQRKTIVLDKKAMEVFKSHKGENALKQSREQPINVDALMMEISNIKEKIKQKKEKKSLEVRESSQQDLVNKIKKAQIKSILSSSSSDGEGKPKHVKRQKVSTKAILYNEQSQLMKNYEKIMKKDISTGAVSHNMDEEGHHKDQTVTKIMKVKDFMNQAMHSTSTRNNAVQQDSSQITQNDGPGRRSADKSEISALPTPHSINKPKLNVVIPSKNTYMSDLNINTMNQAGQVQSDSQAQQDIIHMIGDPTTPYLKVVDTKPKRGFLVPQLNMNNLGVPSEQTTMRNPNINQSQNYLTVNYTMITDVRGVTQNPQDMENSRVMDLQSSRIHNFSLLLDDQLHHKEMPRCIVHPNTLWKTVWNVIMLFFIIFLSVTVPFRIAFEDEPTDEWLYADIVIDSIFLVDLVLNFFTAFEDENGELVSARWDIAKNYMKTWFLVDLMSSIPISLISKLTSSGSVANVKLIKLTRLPRLYRLLRLLKLIRLYKSNKFLEKLIQGINMSIATSRMIKSMVMMIFLLHIIGCLWATVASLTEGDYPENWLISAGLDGSSNVDKYIAAVYWAAVNIYTIGYGDITPRNEVELYANILILFVGVSMYTYIFSKLSTLFSSVNSSDSDLKTRDMIITELAQRHRFTEDLTKRIQFFFSQNSNLISLGKEYAIDELLKILPAHLKSEISYYLYKEAIEIIKILQDKDQRFYGDYLSKFEPMRIKSGTIFAKEGTTPQEVFFLLKGCVECEKQGIYYMEGTIFGETDVVFRKPREENYIAKTDCYILKLDRGIFEQILDEFPDFRDEIQQIVAEREKRRLEIKQQARLKQDPLNEIKELQKMMNKINFDDVKRKQSAHILNKMKQSGASFSEVMNQTFGGKNNLSGLKSNKNSTKNMPQLRGQNSLNVPQTQGLLNKESIMTIEGPLDLSQKKESITIDEQPSQESETIVKKANHGQKLLIDQITNENASSMTNQLNASPEFNYNKLKNQETAEKDPNFVETIKKALTKIQEKQEVLQESDSSVSKDSRSFDSAMVSSHNGNHHHIKQDNGDKHPVNKHTSSGSYGLTEHPPLIGRQQSIISVKKNNEIHDELLEHHEEESVHEIPARRKSNPKRRMFSNLLKESYDVIQPSTSNFQQVRRQSTQIDKPVNAGNPGIQITISDQDDTQQLNRMEQESAVAYTLIQPQTQVDSNLLNQQRNGMNIVIRENIPPQNISDPHPNIAIYNDLFIDNDIQQVAQHIISCQNSITNTKLLINEFMRLFESYTNNMNEYANEIVKKHYIQGQNCLESYLSIINMVEKLIQNIDLHQINEKVGEMHVKTNETEKRFYFLENRVKMIHEIMQRKIKMLEKQHARVLMNKQLQVVRRNPLLDPRDERHTRMNQRLIDNCPTNM